MCGVLKLAQPILTTKAIDPGKLWNRVLVPACKISSVLLRSAPKSEVKQAEAEVVIP